MPDANTGMLHRTRVEDGPNSISSDSSRITPGNLDPAAQSFITANRLEPWLAVACGLIGKAFTGPKAVTVEKKDDPEIQDEWISLRIRVSGPLESAIDSYDAFTAQMAQALPADVSSKIRLSLAVS